MRFEQGIFVTGFVRRSNNNVYLELQNQLLMPHYPCLSPKRFLFVPQLNRPIETPPVLHWTTRPHPYDLEIGLRLQFHSGLGYATLTRLLARVQCSAWWAEYTHYWQTGVLFRLADCRIAILHDSDACLDVKARITKGDADDECDQVCDHFIFLIILKHNLIMYVLGVHVMVSINA